MYQADSQEYAAYVNAVAEQYRLSSDAAKLRFDLEKHKYQGKVDIVKFQLQQLMTTVENMKDISKFSVEFFRTGLGAAMSGINGLAVQNTTV